MTDPIAPIARRAAARLAGRLDPNLPALTERALAGHEETSVRSYDAGVSIALASLLLSAVQFGWQVYRELRDDRKKKEEEKKEEPAQPLQAVLVRRLRLRLAEPRGLPPDKRDQLIEIVAEEILATREADD